MERGLSGLWRSEVPGAVIGQMVMEELKTLDHVAYVRFASVYRNFTDPESFSKEVEALQQQPEPKLVGALQAQLTLPISGEETKEKSPKRTKKSAK